MRDAATVVNVWICIHDYVDHVGISTHTIFVKVSQRDLPLGLTR